MKALSSHYKNTFNLRRKHRRKKIIFPMEKWISDGNRLVGIPFIAKIIPTNSDGMRRNFWRKYLVGNPSDSFFCADWRAGEGRNFRRKFPSEIPAFFKIFFFKI